jgi:hypothetical protein
MVAGSFIIIITQNLDGKALNLNFIILNLEDRRRIEPFGGGIEKAA